MSEAQVMYPAARIRFQPVSANGFFMALRRRVDDHFKTTGAHPTGGAFIATKAAVYLTLAVALYALTVFGGFSGSVTLGLAVAYGVATILLGINVGHDGAHN